MKKRPRINRRDFLRLSVVGAAGATLAACDSPNIFQQDIAITPGSGKVIFNRYTQPSFDPQAAYVYSDDPIIQLDLGQEFARNEHQLARLRAANLALPAADPVFGASLDWAYREYIVHRLSATDYGDDQAAPLGDAPAQAVDLATRRKQMQTIRIVDRPANPADARLCLFNVLVALEWVPGPAYMRQLEWAFRRASDFLYDATDGSMAFGQVVFGGPGLMDGADIQIMASNRLNARSWVSGLHIAAKYTPIRVGRGSWHRYNHVTIPWDEPEAYRMLIHEWAHYALDLRDAYLEPRQFSLGGSVPDSEPYTVIIPNHMVASTSIMATLEGTSELVPKSGGSSANRKSEEWNVITARYPWLNPSQRSLEGPGRLPLPLPRFRRIGTLGNDTTAGQSTGATSNQIQPQQGAQLLLRAFPDGVQFDRCWAYVLKGITPDQPYPQRVIAQGTLDARSGDDGFRLLGAEAGDTIVLIDERLDRRPAVFRSLIDDITVEDGEALARIAAWRTATPDAFPTIDVLPEPAETNAKLGQLRLRVDSAGGPLPNQAWIFPLGQAKPQDAIAFGTPDLPVWVSAPQSVPTLDGHVLMSWGERLMISTFSMGGNPGSGSPHGPPSITAGSSDGTVMLFFKRAEAPDYSHVKVITTIAHGMSNQLPDGARAYSYAFSLASNAPLPADLYPTLIMYYDMPTIDDRGDVRIYRLMDDGAWTALPTYLMPGSAFAATPLNSATAGRLIDDNPLGPRVEHYRVFWTPRAPQATMTG